MFVQRGFFLLEAKMQNLMHVLGADIPHHNSTLLAFFEQLAEQRKLHFQLSFLVVSQQQLNTDKYPHLVIQQFRTQISLASKVIKLAKNSQQRFFFHGQYNGWIWLALLGRQLRGSQIYWHIWGADFYETSEEVIYRWFYQLRRLVQGSIQEVFATEGDANEYLQRYPNGKVSRLYFPAPPASAPRVIREKANKKQQLTILLGNSGDPSNRHLEGLTQICRLFGPLAKIVLPMGYPNNNENYIAKVERQALAIFPANQVIVLRDKLNLADFQQLIASCDLGYFPFERQQGVGTLCLLINYHIPIVLNRKNRFWQDLVSEQLPVLFDTDIITTTVIEETRRLMRQRDKKRIRFMYPGYEADWILILRRLYAEEPE